MDFKRPKLKDLISRIENDIQTKIVGSGAPLRRSLIKILSRAFAGSIHTVYGFLNWLSLQLFVTTATGKQLDRHGFIWGIDRKAATFATGKVKFTGTIGTIIPIDTVVQTDSLIEYKTIEALSIGSSGDIDISVTSLIAGADRNLDSGVILTLQTPIPFVDTDSTVIDPGLLEGSDLEVHDEYRARILFRIQNPPQGGSKSDYVIWATSALTVTNAWVFETYFGAGTVLVTVANYNNETPLVPDLTEVTGIIDIERPVTANVTVLSVIESKVQLTVKLKPNNQATRDSVDAEVKNLLRRRGVPGESVSLNNFGEAVSTSVGVDDYEILEIRQDGLPVSSVINSAIQISVFDSITYLDL